MSAADHLRALHGQRVVSCESGDCLRASMSYVLDMPNGDDLPHDIEQAFLAWRHWLFPFGLELQWRANACWQSGLWLASVPSKNCDDCTHAIVMRGHQVEFDPSPRRRYRKGLNLLGKDVVLGGYAIVVTDFRRLGDLASARSRAQRRWSMLRPEDRP